MYIPQGVWDLIDLSLTNWPRCGRTSCDFEAASPQPGIRRLGQSLPTPPLLHHHLPSQGEWYPRIGLGPDGVSRRVRALTLIKGPVCSPLVADILKTAFPHLTSFRNLQRLEIISSLARILKRLLWIQLHGTVHKTWTTISTIFNILPNLVDLSPSGSFVRADRGNAYSPLPRIQLSDDMELEHVDSLAFDHFKFQELRIGSLIPNSLSFLEYCRRHLRALDLRDLWI